MDAGDVLDLKPLHRQGDCTHYSDVLGLLTHRQPCQSNSNGSPDKKQPSQGKSCPIWEKEKKKTTNLFAAGESRHTVPLPEILQLHSSRQLVTSFAFEQA